MLSAVFSSSLIPLPLRAAGAVFMPLAFSGLTSGLIRRILKRYIKENATQIRKEWVEWHHFEIAWLTDKVSFSIDGNICHESQIFPQGKLGLVIWIDNQYARFAPGESLKFGSLETLYETSMEIKDFEIKPILI